MSTTTVEDFVTALDVMFWGALYPTLAVLPQMRARRSGHVVNITSIGGMVSVPHLLPYTCAKFAAVGLSEGLRAELGQEGIRVTTVVPGRVRSFLQFGDVDLLQRFLCRPTQHSSGRVEARAVAGAIPGAIGLVPADEAFEMRADG